MQAELLCPNIQSSLAIKSIDRFPENADLRPAVPLAGDDEHPAQLIMELDRLIVLHGCGSNVRFELVDPDASPLVIWLLCRDLLYVDIDRTRRDSGIHDTL